MVWVTPRAARLLGRLLVAGALVVAAGASAYRLRARATLPRVASREAPRPPAEGTEWPSAAARVVAPEVAFPADFGVRRVFVDAGHGAPNNPGNTSCFCVDEQDFTLFAARELARRLDATGHFEVRSSRDGRDVVTYADRVAEAERFGAEAFVSLHSDVRTRADRWSPAPGQSCPVSYDAPGFTVIYSDEGDPERAIARRLFAQAEARRLEEVGFPAHDGAAYGPLYEADAVQAGVFVDRHAPDQRIFVLHRPSMPSILIETHHALDPREALRWTEAATLDAFAAATAAALVDALAPDANLAPLGGARALVAGAARP